MRHDYAAKSPGVLQFFKIDRAQFSVPDQPTMSNHAAGSVDPEFSGPRGAPNSGMMGIELTAGSTDQRSRFGSDEKNPIGSGEDAEVELREISIVVGTLNRLPYLRKCVESIVRETRRPFRLYVTDAGSTDGTLDYLRSICSERVTPVLVGKRLGQARAYNEIFERVRSPYTCWLSDDNEVVNGGLDLAANILDVWPRIGMVGLKMRDVQGPFAAAPYVGGLSRFGILNVNQGVLRTETLRTVGGFGLAFRDYGIDPDLTAKVLLSGHDVVLTRAVAVLHHRVWPEDKSSPEYQALMVKHERYFNLYAKKYATLDHLGWFWRVKKAIWYVLRRLFKQHFHFNASAPVLGHLPRDWNNILGGRFISVWDPLITRGQPFHLRQRCPSWLRPRTLPPDPVLDDNEHLAISPVAGSKLT